MDILINGHHQKYSTKKGQNVFVTAILMATAVLITGNNFEKMRTVFQFLGTVFLSSSTFHRIQRDNVVPDVLFLWEEMKGKCNYTVNYYNIGYFYWEITYVYSPRNSVIFKSAMKCRCTPAEGRRKFADLEEN